MHPTASLVSLAGIGGLAAAILVLFVAAQRLAGRRLGEPAEVTRRFVRAAALGSVAWVALLAALSFSGALARFDLRPPPYLFLVIGTLGAGLWLGLSRLGGRLAEGLPVAALVGFQAFRLPLELIMHNAGAEGTMPVELSFGGYNFDVITGATAVPVAALAWSGRAPRALLLAWNALGLVMLGIIAVLALLLSPAVRAFGEDPAHINTWVAFFPFVFLPTVLVVAALAGHLVLLRKLRSSSDERLGLAVKA
ncbi:MAG: hypothetical protein H5U40_11290, partial [Polyangiaceae bacterium]|nr:hypothetical protein [Polyangiaceae bacterium]